MAEVVIMTETQIRTSNRRSSTGVDEDPSTAARGHTGRKGRRHLSSFWRHFLQMLAVMVVGMFAAGALFVTIVGLKSWDEVTTQYATPALLVMAAGMTVPMVAWMIYRGMGWKNSTEMAAAMILPVIPFLCLVWFDVTKSAECAGYCAATVLAMLALMGYRHSVYSRQM
jgi:cytochrome bd-type quinol oxidase subunit 2